MPKFLDVPQWYDSNGNSCSAWTSRGSSGQFLRSEGNGTVSWVSHNVELFASYTGQGYSFTAGGTTQLKSTTPTLYLFSEEATPNYFSKWYMGIATSTGTCLLGDNPIQGAVMLYCFYLKTKTS